METPILNPYFFPQQQNNSIRINIEQQLHQHQQQQQQPKSTANKMPLKRQRLKENSRLLPDHAIQVMNDWYNKHYENPYPSYREFEKMAREGSISVLQVKQWFVNIRRRTKNEYRKRRTTVAKTNSSEVEKFLQDICMGASLAAASSDPADELNDTQNDIDADTHDSSSWTSPFSPMPNKENQSSNSSTMSSIESPQPINSSTSSARSDESPSNNEQYRGFFYHYYAAAASPTSVPSSMNSSLKSPDTSNSSSNLIYDNEQFNYNYNNTSYLNQCYYYNQQQQGFYYNTYN